MAHHGIDGSMTPDDDSYGPLPRSPVCRPQRSAAAVPPSSTSAVHNTSVLGRRRTACRSTDGVRRFVVEQTLFRSTSAFDRGGPAVVPGHVVREPRQPCGMRRHTALAARSGASHRPGLVRTTVTSSSIAPLSLRVRRAPPLSPYAAPLDDRHAAIEQTPAWRSKAASSSTSACR